MKKIFITLLFLMLFIIASSQKDSTHYIIDDTVRWRTIYQPKFNSVLFYEKYKLYAEWRWDADYSNKYHYYNDTLNFRERYSNDTIYCYHLTTSNDWELGWKIVNFYKTTNYIVNFFDDDVFVVAKDGIITINSENNVIDQIDTYLIDGRKISQLNSTTKRVTITTKYKGILLLKIRTGNSLYNKEVLVK